MTGGGGGEGLLQGGGICLHMVDSLCCTAEASNIIKYTPIKRKYV